MRSRRFGTAIGLALLFGFALCAGDSRADDWVEPLEIDTATGAHMFQVEIAKDEPAREKGLMFRRSMPADHGMLFEFDAYEPVAFWMKNTYLKLDMIFIKPDGEVSRIAANAVPMSEKIIPSGGPCIAVLELNGGAAAEIGLKPGDHVKAAFFKP